MDKSKAAKIIFGNKEKKQFPDPEGLEREKPSSAIEGSTQPIGFETNRSRNKFSEAAPPMPGAKQTLNNRLQRVGAVRRGVSLAAPRKEEVDGNMENKTFTQFVTEAKRGRPRKLKPGEQADTEHLQDQLSKLTHANHVTVHFKNGEKHEIPRAHANKALIHLSGLKPIHRADHVEHMHSSKENFYHTLSTKSVPSKKKSITLAGPKLRKEEVEQLDEIGDTKAGKNALGRVALAGMHDTGELRKRAGFADAKGKSNERRDNTTKANKAENKVRNAVARLSDPDYYKQGKFKKEETERPKQNTKTDVDVRKHTRLAADALGRAQSLGRDHKDYDKHMAMYASHRKKALGEEAESDEKKKKDHHKLLQKFKHRIDEVKAIKGNHANKLHAAKVINPGKVGYAGKGTKPKVQSLHREDYAPLESGDKQAHVDQKTVDAKSRKQGGEKPKKPKMELTKEAWELYDSLSDAHKTIFEKMAQTERDKLVDKYIKDGGQVQKVKATKRSENSKSFPASKRAGTVFNKGAKRVHLQNKGVKGK